MNGEWGLRSGSQGKVFLSKGHLSCREISRTWRSGAEHFSQEKQQTQRFKVEMSPRAHTEHGDPGVTLARGG